MQYKLDDKSHRHILLPVQSPTVQYRVMIFVAAALDANPVAAIKAPIIVTIRHPNRFVRELAIGPTPSVIPTKIEGINETEARVVPLNPSINATTNIPNE